MWDLQDAGYDMLNCDNGTYDAWYWAHPPIYMPENCNLEDVEHIRKFVDIPVVCAGRLDPRVAASAESYKGKLRDLLAWYKRQMEQMGIEIHLNTMVAD